MIRPPTAEELLAKVRSCYSPSHPYYLAIESMADRLTPDEIRRHLPLLPDLALVKEAT